MSKIVYYILLALALLIVLWLVVGCAGWRDRDSGDMGDFMGVAIAREIHKNQRPVGQ